MNKEGKSSEIKADLVGSDATPLSLCTLVNVLTEHDRKMDRV